ncbi:MAG: hypothetical protein J4415_03850 [Candidatus Diapherotrites archaeon]|uniref:Uncharacterized protein n=1 Tax=Candidatus Iainarchaeum sp. TaxID=3101447 RepID=A0A8T4KVZ5_9ARCH|nr:hypothetical protein [Candidatus Diapherotrites archaeon]
MGLFERVFVENVMKKYLALTPVIISSARLCPLVSRTSKTFMRRQASTGGTEGRFFLMSHIIPFPVIPS